MFDPVRVSTNGGGQPLWAPDGRELFYQGPEGIMFVSVQSEPDFAAGIPEVLFDGSYRREAGRNFDIHPDGQRFLMVTGNEGASQLNVILNWTEELTERVPVP